MTSTPIVTAIMEQTVTFSLTLHILGLRAGSRLIQIIIKSMIHDERRKQQVASGDFAGNSQQWEWVTIFREKNRNFYFQKIKLERDN